MEMQDRFLKLPEVLQKLGVSKSTLYREIKEKRVPAPINFGGSKWRESEINAVIRARS